MANHEHLRILQKGVKVWNQWRIAHPEIAPDLFSAQLRGMNIQGGNFQNTKLRITDFSNANLSYANLSGADLIASKLHGAELYRAELYRTDLYRADLYRADFNSANLRGAHLSGADLRRANFRGADLSAASFTQATANNTIFADNDLREVIGLEEIIHKGPSEVSISTISRSQGKVSVTFLRGCGLNDWQIESAKLHQPGLSNEEITNILYRIHDLRAHQAIQISPLFISYSHADGSFVDEMEKCLNKKGIRFWRDIHHATAGQLERQVDRAIRLNPTVLLVLSRHSIESDWVQHEARLARNLEIQTKRDVLCPVALDDSWKDCRWPARLREQIMEYNILDFSEWRDEDKFRRMFSRLLDGLELFYK